MPARACISPAASAGPTVGQQTTQHSSPVVFPNLTGKSAPPPRGSLPLRKCLISCDLPLSILEERCEDIGFSVQVICQSIWARLLSQYTGEVEVSFGAFSPNSPIIELERDACLCKVWGKNIYTVDVAFAPGKSVGDVRRELNDNKRDSQNDTYETILSVYSANGEIPQVARAAADSQFVVHLEILLNTKTDSVQLTIHYEPAFLTADSAVMIAREFSDTLAFKSKSSGEAPTRFSRLQPELLSICQPSGNAPVTVSDRSLFVHHLFEGHAAETPDRVCLEFLNDDTDQVESWNFKMLNEKSNRIAHLILEHGVARDEAVPVCLDKSALYYACILACMKAGVPFTPIDPVAPVARKAFMIQELQARYVISSPHRFDELQLPSEVKLLDVVSEDCLKRLSAENPQVLDLTERSLAYRLYTSGSTGQPKAVSLEVGSVVHAIQRSITILPLHHDTRLLQFAAITFDMCYFDCFLAWTVGFTLISASKRYLLGELEAIVKRLRISFLDLTPSVAATLTTSELPEVEMLYCIGEAMPTKIVEDWEGRCVNSYGPTEAAMLCTITDVKKNIKSANFGQPFDGMSLYILDKDTPVILPRMAAGELCICGPQLAREYHRNEAKTASSFITLDSGLRLYRTGDLARMLADGTFEFIGRKDDQVKLRGFRIELGEVSAVLREVHPLIKDVVALVLKHSEEEKEQLVTFLSFASRKNRLDPPSIQECDDAKWEEIEKAARRVAEGALPQYMLPHIYFPINWIPLSAAAKVDKRSLGELFRKTDISTLGRKVDVGVSSEILDDISVKIRDVFAEASNSDPDTIGMDTTIYQLGLDSISALTVARSLKAIGINASVLDIIECPTIRGLREHISGKKNPVSAAAHQDSFASFKQRHIQTICRSAGVSREKVANVLPCSPMQEGILSQFLQSNGQLYYNTILFTLEKDIDLHKLEQAWKMVAEQNDVLRTGFATHEVDGGHYAMVVYKSTSDSSIRRIESQFPVEQLAHQIKNKEAQRILSDISCTPWSVTFVSTTGSPYMLFTALHAIYDAHTLQILLSDVNNIYYGTHPVIHSSFSLILKEMLRVSREKEAIDCAADYWQSNLQDCPVTKFPVMTPLKIDTREFLISYKQCLITMKSVEDLCKKAGFSLGAVGQAAWAKILAMYFGEADVCFGSVVSGRTGADNAEDVVFPCLATIPMRVQLNGDNKSLLSQIQGRLGKMVKFQHTPLRAIQRALGRPEQSLFDTIFVYQRSGSFGDKSRALWKELDAKATVEYPVSFEIEPTDDGYLGLRLTGRTDILPKEQMDTIVSQYEYLLMHILQHQDADVMDLGDAPKEIISDTPAEFDRLPCEVEYLHEFVSESAKRHPDKIALEFATAIHGNRAVKDSWTYRQFDDMGNKIANFLLQHGAATGDLIGICFDKTPQAYFGILGILKAGCAFVALDFSAPIQRRSFIVEDAKIKIVLTMSAFARDFVGIEGLKVYALDNLQALTRYFSPGEPEIENLTPHHLSYVLYTSGTTGTPKGCRITHENAIQAMLSFQTLFKGHWDENSRFLQFASLHFDVSVLEQYWSWSVGICMTGAPRDLIFQDLGNAIRALEITHIDLTPSLARLITPEDTPSLCRGVFITGGEKLKQDVLDAWGERDVIYNGYGPTEATIGVTMYPRVPKNGRPSNIGPQFVNVGSMVLKPKTDIPVLLGAVGELCVTGALVGDGYLNREDLTRERFPYINGKRMYRTGDLVRQLYNGCFDYLGRADDQVKLRGQRLELGEINETIRAADQSIAEIVTLVCQHGQQQVQQLVSFVSFRDNTEGCGSPSPAQLLKAFPESGLRSKILQACQSRLPVYMVPTYILPITKLPLTVNNKVDERTLRTLFADTSVETIQEFEEVCVEDEEFSEAEQRIKDTLSVVAANTGSATKSTSFFQLGLDSVSIVGFANKLRKNGFPGVEVSLVMQNPNIASLAKALENSMGLLPDDGLQSALQKIKAFKISHGFDISSSLGLNEQDIENIMPCTPLQEGMIARALNSDAPLYFNTFCFKLANDIPVSTLQNAWQEVIDRTDILRTCFCETSDGIAQVVLKRFTAEWKTLQAVSMESLTNPYRKPVSLSDFTVPPLSLEHITFEGESYLRLSIFHALYDGTSMPMILADVENMLSGRPLIKRMQFSEAAPRILSLDLEKAKKFWKAHMGEVELSPLQLKSSKGRSKEHTLSHILEFSQKNIEDLAQKLDCTVQALFQAVCAQALFRILEKQVVMGMITSGRSFTVDNIESCIGPLFNSIPCYLPLAKDTTWRRFAQQAHSFNTSSTPYHHTPLRQISKWIGQGSKPLFDVLFVFQPATPSIREKVLVEVDSSAILDYPIALEIVQDSNGQYTISVTSNSDYLDESEASLLLKSTVSGMTDLLTNPDKEVSVLQELDTSIFASTSEDTEDTRMETVRPTEFTWTETALAIRQELSVLTGIIEDEINEKSSIYQIGLDSVEAIRLSSRLQKRGIVLKVSDIMREATIERMLKYLKAHQADTHYSEPIKDALADFGTAARTALKLPLHKLREIESILPTTPLQDVMVAETMGSDFTLYFNHDVLELSNSVNIERLQAAWSGVIRKNPILRTTFEESHELELSMSADYIQVVWKDISIEWDIIETQSEHESGRVDELISSHKSRKSPLSLGIIRSEKRNLMVLSISHALYDGHSMGMLLGDIIREYNGHGITRPDYKPFLSRTLNMDKKSTMRFWTQLLSNATTRKLSLEGLDEDIWRAESESKVSAQDFTRFCRNQRISESVLGQACWGFLLSDILAQDDVIFGTVISGRETEESEEYMFPTMNTIPVRAILHGTASNTLELMQRNYSKSLEHQFVSLREIQKQVCEQGQRMFDTLFIYQKHRQIDAEEKMWKSVGGASRVEYAIAVEIEVTNNILTWRISTLNSVMSAEEAHTTLINLDSILQKIIAQPTTKYQEFSGYDISTRIQERFQSQQQQVTEVPEDDPSTDSADYKQLETQVINAVSVVSKVKETEIKPGTSIFHLGIDSISAIRLASELRKKAVFIAVSEIMKAPTVKKICLLLVKKQQKPVKSLQPTIQAEIPASQFDKLVSLARLRREDVEDISTATAGQTFLIKAWESSQGRIFLPTFLFKAAESLRSPRLKRSMEKIISSNPILRTTFISEGDEVYQVVHKSAAPSFRSTYFDSELVAKHHLEDINKEEQARTYDMSIPSVRVHLVSARKESYIFLTLHHALYDAFTLPTLLSQLSDIYQNEDANLPTPTKPIVTSSKPEMEQFWTKYFTNASSTLLPQQATLNITERVELYQEKHVPDSSKIDATCRKHGISLHSLSIACFAQVLSGIVKNENPVFGVYLSNRHLADDSTGAPQTTPTLNMVPLMVKNASSSSLLILAKQVQEDMLEISMGDAASTNLLDIHKWAGIRIDSFVNFLKEDRLDGNSRNGGLFDRFDLAVGRPVAREFSIPELLRSSQSIIQTNLDLEMASRDGFIDVGLFAAGGYLSQVDLKNIADDIRDALVKFT
ncbi:hypothetical protein H072_9546 [Dactylellina haptotyla CBS 200.50]|uniref:Carrier domain-containing protein n=1 Tax=Dactylellina haptotyla (strain CBS 200.50) TaxID=1284197 RepID=S8A1S5_DACHA|nr:hypothetical protein H072_9546 [Dactylellina haptotyla CBS 200.50]